MSYANQEMDALQRVFDWGKAITGTGREIYDNVKGRPANPAPVPTAPAPKAQSFNWKPWAIGGGIVLLALVLLKALTGSKK